METIFKYIVVISMLLFVALHVLPFIDYLWLSDEALILAAYDGFGSILPYNIFIYWGLLAVWVFISIGLFLFIPVARTAFVAMQIVSLAASFFYGFSVKPPISTTLGDIVIMADGALLVMLYLTSVSNHFARTPNKALKADRASRAAL